MSIQSSPKHTDIRNPQDASELKDAPRNAQSSGYHICLFGAPMDTGNMGVSALGASLMKIIYDLCPNASISLLVGNRSATPYSFQHQGQEKIVKIVNYRLSPRARLQEHLFWILFLALLHRLIPISAIRQKIIRANHWLKTLQEADLVGDINGGDSFSDIYGLRRLLIGSIPAVIAFLLDKQLILLPQTYGPYQTRIARYLAKQLISRADRIVSRDQEGLEVIKKILNTHLLPAHVFSCPDIAFQLEVQLPEQLNISPELSVSASTPLVGLNISGLLYNGGYTRDNMFKLLLDYPAFASMLIRHFLETTPVHILLLPHTFAAAENPDDDVSACYKVASTLPKHLRNRVYMLNQEYNQHHIKAIIGLCDFFIGSRMHACIAALSQGIPTTAVAYSDKFQGVFQSVTDIPLVIDSRTTTPEIARQQIMKHFENRSEIRKTLQQPLKDIKEQTYSLFRALLKTASQDAAPEDLQPPSQRQRYFRHSPSPETSAELK